MTNGFAEYSHAIAAMAAFALMTLILAPLSGYAKAKDGVVAGGAPPSDYANAAYRLWRAHMSATEIIGAFTAATIAAMLAGAAPFWVNLAAVVFLVSRIAHAAVHIAGIGAADRGLRSILFVIGWIICAVLAIMAIAAAL